MKTLKELIDFITTVIENERYYDVGEVDITQFLESYNLKEMLDEKFITLIGITVKFRKEVLKDESLDLAEALHILQSLSSRNNKEE